MPGSVGRPKGPERTSVKITKEGKDSLDKIAAILEEVTKTEILTDATVLLDDYLNSVDYDYNKVKELRKKYES